jgi:hypothetical protein
LANDVSSNSKTVTTDEYFQSFCREILNRHYFIRSAAIADHLGHLIAAVFRQGLVPLLTNEESSRAAAQAAIRTATRNKFKPKIGELQFSLSRYDKLVRPWSRLRMVKKLGFCYC